MYRFGFIHANALNTATFKIDLFTAYIPEGNEVGDFILSVGALVSVHSTVFESSNIGSRVGRLIRSGFYSKILHFKFYNLRNG